MNKNKIKAAACAVSLFLFLALFFLGIFVVMHYAPAWVSVLLLGVAIIYVFTDAFAFFYETLEDQDNNEKEEGENGLEH